MGALADRAHRPRLIAAGLLIWSAATVSTGLATSYVGLLVPRMIVGVGEAVLGPGALSMLSERFPAQRLGMMNGVFALGAPVGIALSLIAVGAIAPAFGWRTVFYGIGFLGIIAVIALLFVRESSTRAVVKRASGAAGFSEQASDVWNALRSSPSMMATMAGGFIAQLPFGAATFEQLWFVGERGLDRGPTAVKFGIIALVVSVFGSLAGGALADVWRRRFGSGRTMIIVLSMTVFVPIALAARLVPVDHPVFWLGPIVLFLSIGILFGSVLATIQELATVRVRGSIIAVFIVALTIGRDVVGTTSAGVLVDMLIARGVEQPYTWMLFTFTCLGALSAPFFLYAAFSFRRDVERLAPT